MKHLKKAVPFVLALLVFVLLAAGCASEPVEVEVPVEVTRVVEVEVTRVVTEEVIVEGEPAVEVPYEELWASSGHADATAEAFRHWDEDDPKVVSSRCAKCHTPTGYQEFLGADGTAFGVVEADHAPADQGITCVACHNEVTLTLTSVVMPSGIELTGLGDEARCMQCHQGRASKVTVDTAIAEAGVEDDVVSEDLGFINIHYYAAAATKYGTFAQGGYEYEGKTYDGNFAHVDGYNTCIGCHNPHTLEIKVEECQACHTDVETAEDFKDVRMVSSLVDYDGDGDLSEGVAYEIAGLQEILYAAMQAYAQDALGVGLVYDAGSYPYFFDDAGERFSSWTPRLVKAAYNYQVSLKDTGAFAHGGKYIIELLYDSIEDLNPELVAGLHRVDHGHFAGSEEPFRHWDEDGGVSASCSKCHSATGLPLYLAEGVTITQPVSNGFQCATCHDNVGEFTLRSTTEVTFPSGATIAVEEGDPSGLCMTCHQGRSSKLSVDGLIGDQAGDALGEGLRFQNIHYFAAGATRYGTEVQGAYEFDGQEYVGFFEHVPGADQCIECHNAHELNVRVDDKCSECHEVSTLEDLQTIRGEETPDYDGDGNVDEGIYGEIETMAEVLYAAMQAYTEGIDGVALIVYDSHAYPYFFDDAGGRYSTWTPNLLRAAYNYQYVQKDPGAFAHNGKYIVQVLYDSIQAMGGDVSAMTRP